MKHRFHGRMASRRLSIASLVVSLAALAVAAPAMAVPKGEFSVFAQCPLSNPNTLECIYNRTTSGEVKIGNTAVPITNAITLQGGSRGLFTENAELIPAANGETLSKTAQTVPGGLLSIVAPEGWPKILQDLFNKFINEGATGVTAVTELVGKAEVHFIPFLTTEGTAVTLPVRVKLNNGFLGSACYIGSSSSPIRLNLTTGKTSPPLPNKSITGSPGTFSENAEESILFDKGFSLVDNSFSAPGAEGCGGIFAILVDLAVDVKLGLPSSAGHNSATLKGEQELASASTVREHS